MTRDYQNQTHAQSCLHTLIAFAHLWETTFGCIAQGLHLQSYLCFFKSVFLNKIKDIGVLD